MRRFSGAVWRLILRGADPLAPAQAPEGRFHHAGQRALFCSLMPEGTILAMQRYLARAEGAQAMLYSSRSRPELRPNVLFDRPEALAVSVGLPRPCAE